MRLKQRIKKLEENKRLTNSDADFCGCFRKHVNSSIEAAYHPEKDVKIHPQPDFDQKVCQICEKPINERDAAFNQTIEFFYGEKQKE